MIDLQKFEEWFSQKKLSEDAIFTFATLKHMALTAWEQAMGVEEVKCKEAKCNLSITFSHLGKNMEDFTPPLGIKPDEIVIEVEESESNEENHFSGVLKYEGIAFNTAVRIIQCGEPHFTLTDV